MLGHASAAMTLDVYAGLFGDDLDAVVDSPDAAARRSGADICGHRRLRRRTCRSARSAQIRPDQGRWMVGRAGLEPATGGL